MAEQQKVRFIRKNGRIIPIRPKDGKQPQPRKAERQRYPTPSDVGGMAASGSLAGGSTYGAVRGIAARFGVKASRISSIISKYTPEMPRMPSGTLNVTKKGKVTKARLGRGMADIFERTTYAKQMARFNARTSRLQKLSTQMTKLTKYSGMFKRAALPAAGLSFAAGAITSYLNDD